MNLPNKITICRIALIPFFVVFFFLPEVVPHSFLYATIFFALAAFTDFLDGYIARKYNMVTDLGKFLDPIADKVLVLTALILMLTNYNGYSGNMPSIFGGVGTEESILPAIIGGVGVSIILARELIVSSFRMVAASKNVVIAADKLGKIKTVTQDIAVLLLLFSQAFENAFFYVVYVVGFWLFVLSVILTIISGFNYIFKNRQVFKEEKKAEKSEEA